jgi:lactoylglutathione lyase
MIVVSDMARSVGFYRDRLGLSLRFESPFWSEFDCGQVTLALHGGGASSGRTPTGRADTAGDVHLSWQVRDADATHAALLEKGVAFVRPPEEMPEEGIKLASFLDPDGTQLSLWQSTR